MRISILILNETLYYDTKNIYKQDIPTWSVVLFIWIEILIRWKVFPDEIRNI